MTCDVLFHKCIVAMASHLMPVSLHHQHVLGPSLCMYMHKLNHKPSLFTPLFLFSFMNDFPLHLLQVFLLSCIELTSLPPASESLVISCHLFASILQIMLFISVFSHLKAYHCYSFTSNLSPNLSLHSSPSLQPHFPFAFSQAPRPNLSHSSSSSFPFESRRKAHRL